VTLNQDLFGADLSPKTLIFLKILPVLLRTGAEGGLLNVNEVNFTL
jgi:hypothetical protein